jgi:hypothetical protein
MATYVLFTVHTNDTDTNTDTDDTLIFYSIDKLTSLGYTSSLIDDCVFFRGDIIFIVYVDDGIFLGHDDVQLLQAIKEIQGLGLNIEDQGHPADHVGGSIKKHCNGFYEFTQGALIDSIIKDAGISNSKTKPVPAKVFLQLHAFKNEQVFDIDFNYRSVVGKLNYLAQTTCPKIMYATHQIAKYSSDPRQLHCKAILYLICNLKKTRDLGLGFKPDSTKGFECYCDADSQGCGTRHLHLWSTVLPSHEVVGSFSMQDALSLGPPNFNPKLHPPLLKLSILQCHK